MIKKFIRKNYVSALTAVFIAVVILTFLPEVLIYAFNVDNKSQNFDTFMRIVIGPFFLSWISLYALIFSKNLRDEYLDKIWQKSMKNLALAIFIVPWFWFAAWLFKGHFLPDEYWLLKDPNEFLFRFNGADENNISQLQKSGVDFALMQIMVFSPMVFVALFKWHAWRDRT